MIVTAPSLYHGGGGGGVRFPTLFGDHPCGPPRSLWSVGVGGYWWWWCLLCGVGIYYLIFNVGWVCAGVCCVSSVVECGVFLVSWRGFCHYYFVVTNYLI